MTNSDIRQGHDPPGNRVVTQENGIAVAKDGGGVEHVSHFLEVRLMYM